MSTPRIFKQINLDLLTPQLAAEVKGIVAKHGEDAPVNLPL